jgi:hypothetical protein
LAGEAGSEWALRFLTHGERGIGDAPQCDEGIVGGFLALDVGGGTAEQVEGVAG